MPGTGILTFTAVAPGTSAVTVEVDDTGAANAPLSITVVGSAITIQKATDAAGNPLGVPQNSGVTFLALYNATPAAVALATVSVTFPALAIPGSSGPVSMGPASSGQPLLAPLSSLLLFDSNKVQVSNAPLVDIYMDGGQPASFVNPTGGVYGNGSITPPLFYPKDSVLQIDVYSQITDASKLPTSLLIHLVGKKYYPC